MNLKQRNTHTHTHKYTKFYFHGAPIRMEKALSRKKSLQINIYFSFWRLDNGHIHVMQWIKVNDSAKQNTYKHYIFVFRFSFGIACFYHVYYLRSVTSLQLDAFVTRINGCQRHQRRQMLSFSYENFFFFCCCCSRISLCLCACAM